MEIKNDFIITGADTDSISFCRKDGKPFSNDEQNDLIVEINNMLPDLIKYENDGYFKKMAIIKAKNYAMIEHGSKKVIIKGSGLKATTKEIALKALTSEIIHCLLDVKKDRIFDLYSTYCSEVMSEPLDISRWTSKKTISKAVLKPTRTNEEKVLKAIEGIDVQEGDKIRVYFDTTDALKLEQNYSNDHNPKRLLKKIYSIMKVFENVIDLEMLPNYTLARNKDLLDNL